MTVGEIISSKAKHFPLQTAILFRPNGYRDQASSKIKQGEFRTLERDIFCAMVCYFWYRAYYLMCIPYTFLAVFWRRGWTLCTLWLRYMHPSFITPSLDCAAFHENYAKNYTLPASVFDGLITSLAQGLTEQLTYVRVRNDPVHEWEKLTKPITR